jgi:hypothetical protein
MAQNKRPVSGLRSKILRLLTLLRLAPRVGRVADATSARQFRRSRASRCRYRRSSPAWPDDGHPERADAVFASCTKRCLRSEATTFLRREDLQRHEAVQEQIPGLVVHAHATRADLYQMIALKLQAMSCRRCAKKWIGSIRPDLVGPELPRSSWRRFNM